MENQPNELYDVLIVESETRVVAAIPATRTHYDRGFHSALRYRNTWMTRVNDAFVVEIAPTGLFEEGAIIPKEKCVTIQGEVS